MENRTCILLAVGISLLVLTTSAGAQDEQWLQYHSEREAQQIIGGMSSSRTVTSNKPQDVKLPEFKTQQQFFIEWATPMVKSGRLWIALDRTSEQGKWDRLFIDSNGNGHLDDEDAVTAYRTEQYYTYFGPVKIVFEGEDGPISYHLNFRFYDYNEQNRRLYIYSGGWYEGEVTVAGEKKYCMLIDYNVNGTFDDKSVQANQSDRIQIGKKGSQDNRFVGNYIEVDDVLYRTEIARDGAFVKLSGADDVKFGNIRVPTAITEFAAGGENGLFTRELKDGVGRLPVGKYRIDHWEIDRKDEKGKSWTMRGSSFGERGNFEITEEAETALEIGEPVTANLQVNLNGENYEFSKSLQGTLGEYISLTSAGSDVSNLWKMAAKNKDGTFAKTYPMPDQ
jgi:predicted heme/steroid binding protein